MNKYKIVLVMIVAVIVMVVVLVSWRVHKYDNRIEAVEDVIADEMSSDSQDGIEKTSTTQELQEIYDEFHGEWDSEDGEYYFTLSEDRLKRFQLTTPEGDWYYDDLVIAYIDSDGYLFLSGNTDEIHAEIRFEILEDGKALRFIDEQHGAGLIYYRQGEIE